MTNNPIFRLLERALAEGSVELEFPTEKEAAKRQKQFWDFRRRLRGRLSVAEYRRLHRIRITRRGARVTIQRLEE
jgi:hypothetical protein